MNEEERKKLYLATEKFKQELIREGIVLDECKFEVQGARVPGFSAMKLLISFLFIYAIWEHNIWAALLCVGLSAFLNHFGQE